MVTTKMPFNFLPKYFEYLLADKFIWLQEADLSNNAEIRLQFFLSQGAKSW